MANKRKNKLQKIKDLYTKGIRRVWEIDPRTKIVIPKPIKESTRKYRYDPNQTE